MKMMKEIVIKKVNMDDQDCDQHPVKYFEEVHEALLYDDEESFVYLLHMPKPYQDIDFVVVVHDLLLLSLH